MRQGLPRPDRCAHRYASMQVTARAFDFVKLVRAHGWVFLAPFQWDEAGLLSRPLRLPRGGSAVVRISVRNRGGKSLVTIRPSTAALTQADRESIRAQVRRMLCLDLDFSEFHRLCADDALLKFVSTTRCGGLLRAPTAFEDLVKTVCTTNCDWRNTKRMCEQLCALDGGGFPTPELLLQFSARRLASKVSLGYRTDTVCSLARLSAAGKLPLDEWAARGEYEQVRAALRAVRGVGPYSINHMLVLLGWYGDIPVDSEVLRYLRQTHFSGAPASPDEAVQPYERYGRYRFLAYKFGRMAGRTNYINK